jgi:hypothetical protein
VLRGVIATALTAVTATAFGVGPVAAKPAGACRGAVAWQKGVTLEGRVATLKGRVASTNFAMSSNGSPTFLDVGNPYPDPNRLTVVIWIENRSAFGKPENRYAGRMICVRGLVTDYNGSPEIVARSPSQIAIAG